MRGLVKKRIAYRRGDNGESLRTIWDADTEKTFKKLSQKQKNFVIEYLKTFHGGEAYKAAYNPQCNNLLAASCGSRLLANPNVAKIMSVFNDNKIEAVSMVVHGYREMSRATKPEWLKGEDGQYENVGELPDWQARKEALLGLRKVHGIDAAEKTETKHTGEVVIVELPKKNAP